VPFHARRRFANVSTGSISIWVLCSDSREGYRQGNRFHLRIYLKLYSAIGPTAPRRCTPRRAAFVLATQARPRDPTVGPLSPAQEALILQTTAEQTRRGSLRNPIHPDSMSLGNSNTKHHPSDRPEEQCSVLAPG
jgi:hypothetical protein